MKILDVKQNSPEWLQARLGIATASEMHNLVTPLGKIKTGGAVDTYLYTKLAEKWVGRPLVTFSGGFMEQGSIREEEAIPWLEFSHDMTIHRVGFITSDDVLIGCSPDGLIEEREQGVEIKCPAPNTHIKYLLDGELPEEYRMQVQGSMLVTGFKTWRFLSYTRGFPPLLLTVQRDEKAIQALSEALTAFNSRLADGWARLVELNGGVGPEVAAAEAQERAELAMF